MLLGLWVRPVVLQKGAADRLRSQGVDVSYSFEVNKDDPSIFVRGLRAKLAQEIGPDWFGNVAVLQFQLSAVDIVNVRDLRPFPALRVLSLTEMKISAWDCETLGLLRNVERLSLANTDITNDHISYLHCLPKLRYLDLAGTEIDDESVESLAKLKGLRDISLSQTAITVGGMKRLRAELPPTCNIEAYGYVY